MLERFKYTLRDFVLRHAHGPYATPALAFISAFESIASPVPLEVVLGPLIVARPDRWLYFTSVAVVASVGGALIGYGIGFALYDVLGAPIVSLYGFSGEIAAASELLRENMFSATFISAFTPIPYKVFVLTAGILGGPLGIFVVASVLGRGIRFFIFSYLVHRFGGAIARLAFRYFTIATIAVVVLLALALLVVYST